MLSDSILDSQTFDIITALRLTVSPSTDQVNGDSHATNINRFLDGLPLRLHMDRLKASASAFGWIEAAAIVQANDFELTLGQRLLMLLSEIRSNHQQKLSFKIRISMSRDGSLRVLNTDPHGLKPPLYPLTFSANPFSGQLNSSGPDSSSSSCKVTLAQSPIEPSLFTQHKTTLRSMYNAAYVSLIKNPLHPPLTVAEVLLFNPSGQIMEATSCTVYFPNPTNTAWLTPDLESGGNASTTRAWAIHQGWCTEGKIGLSVVKQMHGQTVWLSNAVRGFWSASICLVPEEWEAHLHAWVPS